MRRIVAALVCLTGIGCGESEPSEAKETVVLRVSAGHDLNAFVPGEASGAAVYAMDLVFEPRSDHADIERIEGNRVVMRRREQSPYSASRLSEALQFSGLVAKGSDEDLVWAEFETDALAAEFSRYHRVFDLGPYRVARTPTVDDTTLTLVERGDMAIDRIEVVSAKEGEEWRRLIAQDVDVIPATSVLNHHQFEGMRSIRTVELDVKVVMTLHFNSGIASLADREVRRGLAAAIDLSAIHRLACGQIGCDPELWTAEPIESDVPLPSPLILLVLETDTSAQVAAGAIRSHLSRVGVEIRIVSLDLATLRERILSGDFELLLLPLPIEPAHAVEIFTDEYQHARFHYRHPAIDEAHSTGEFAPAFAALAHDLPALPLYEMHMIAAIDRRFCGGEPRILSSWAWLADLHPCDDP